MQAVTTALSTLHPAGPPGCDLLVRIDHMALLLPVAGIAQFTFSVPDSGAIVGVQLFQQVVQVEFGAASITSISGSNGVDLTVGVF